MVRRLDLCGKLQCRFESTDVLMLWISSVRWEFSSQQLFFKISIYGEIVIVPVRKLLRGRRSLLTMLRIQWDSFLENTPTKQLKPSLPPRCHARFLQEPFGAGNHNAFKFLRALFAVVAAGPVWVVVKCSTLAHRKSSVVVESCAALRRGMCMYRVLCLAQRFKLLFVLPSS